MKMKFVPAMTLAAVSLALPFASMAQSDQPDASKMVSAQVVLKDTLDAKKLQPNATFSATLAGKVHLANGPELPAGTVLIGQVADDDMQIAGNSKIVVRFTSAKLKNGQTIPVKATIVHVINPDDVVYESFSATPAQTSAKFDEGLKVDQLNVRSGVDMHSKIASGNSGVFVSTSGKDVQLKAGSEFAIAIAATSQSGTGTAASGGR